MNILVIMDVTTREGLLEKKFEFCETRNKCFVVEDMYRDDRYIKMNQMSVGEFDLKDIYDIMMACRRFLAYRTYVPKGKQQTLDERFDEDVR